MSIINLFYLSPNTTGGWVTFTAHLVDALRTAGHTPVLRKVGKNTEKKDRNFGYGLCYRNTSEADAYQLCMEQPSLIVAAAKKFSKIAEEMFDLGAKIVVHDPTELKNLPNSLLDHQDQCVVIRKMGLEMLPNATFIRHPYTRQSTQTRAFPKKKLCVSTSRIDFDKHTTLLLEANRLLPDDKKIDIRGFENRLYTRFKVCPSYPEWRQSIAHYPRTREAAFEILLEAKFMADMSLIKGDGGGTQYTFLEAWDAGCVPIIQTDWLIDGDDMVPNINCLSVSSGKDIAHYLGRCDINGENTLDDLVVNGYGALKRHSPEIIGGQYTNFLNL